MTFSVMAAFTPPTLGRYRLFPAQFSFSSSGIQEAMGPGGAKQYWAATGWTGSAPEGATDLKIRSLM